MIHRDDRMFIVILIAIAALWLAAIVAWQVGFSRGRELRRDTPPTISEVAIYGFKGGFQ